MCSFLVLICGISLCRAFRETFRRLTDDEPVKDVMDRHSVFYHFGRALSEAVEHFGTALRANEKVFHGLNCSLFFRSFTEHFNAPTSTTKDENTGT